jgi:hypothetical protein
MDTEAARTLTGFAVHPDDRLPSLAELVGSLAEPAALSAEGREAGLHLSDLRLELPLELDLVVEGGRLALDAAPPLQRTETSVMPVWHRLAVHIAADHGDTGSLEA